MTDQGSSSPRRWTIRRVQAGLIALALCGAGSVAMLAEGPWLSRSQERIFDAMAVRMPVPAQAGTKVLVVDIGATDENGLPWTRAASARLATALAEGKPAVLAWDIVFAGSCDSTLADNAALAAALSQGPSVLGFLLSGIPSAPPRPLPALALGKDVGPRLWAAPGAEVPCPAFAAAAPSLGAVSLPGDQTARVRMVPAAVTVADTVYPSLAVAALQRAGQAALPVLTDGNGPMVTLRLGDRVFPLDRAGTLRFRPRPLSARNDRTIPAEAVLSGFAQMDRLQGAVVFVGSSLPQRGGLRPTAADPLYPSVQIAADLATGLMQGNLPWRPFDAPRVEALATALAGVAVALMLTLLSPFAAFGGTVALGLAMATGTVALHGATGRLYDPAFPALTAIVAALAGLVVKAAVSTRAERLLRTRMGQLLPGPVVARLADDPQLLRLQGERRQVTALFTDLEGFSGLVATLPPDDLIARLDRYFGVVTGSVLRHGGMIDKIVGDAVHALFNAPLDQPGHVDAALAAAADIMARTEALRAELAFGRTRIGVETGPAILGDVGGGARIDYTAHGPAVNLAARLQDMGKTLGPSVIVGPAAAAAATAPLRPLGTADVRSFGPLALFTLP